MDDGMGDKKRCITCGEVKHVTDFSFSTAYYDGRVRQTGAKTAMLDWLHRKLQGHNRSRHGPAWVVLPWANGGRFADFPEW